MKSIIQNITTEKSVEFIEEESIWFNGHMNNPVKTYRFNYPSTLGIIEVIGEYRRNTWQKANWYKNIHFTDIYLWTIKLNTRATLPSIEIEANSWLNQKIFMEPKLKVSCSNPDLKKSLENSQRLSTLLLGKHENVSATIRTVGQTLCTSFNTQIDHEGLIRKALHSIEEIEEKIKTTANN